MTHALLRISVWIVVLGIGYLVFGPKLFDSTGNNNPFQHDTQLFLPPAKSPRLIEYEQRLQQRELGPDELAEYQSLVRERQAGFWKGDDVTVEEALHGVARERKAHLAAILEERGLSREELAVFFMVVQRDRPSLLEDRD